MRLGVGKDITAGERFRWLKDTPLLFYPYLAFKAGKARPFVISL